MLPLVLDHDRRQFGLESSWTDIVVGYRSLDKRQRDHQEAVWELLTTEVEYIHKLRVIIDVRRSVVFQYSIVSMRARYIVMRT